jgi:L-lactate dehydrogenase (cytochrome)
MQIFVDGGIRRGTDIVKALALGATAVGIGRPALFALSGGYGERGVRRMLGILRQELQVNMALAGAATIGQLEAGMVNTSGLERDLIGAMKL